MQNIKCNVKLKHRSSKNNDKLLADVEKRQKFQHKTGKEFCITQHLL